jgi:hypothetical protein
MRKESKRRASSWRPIGTRAPPIGRNEDNGAGMADHRLVGKTGRVTGRVGPGRIGEVVIPVRGGTEAFHAYANDKDEEIITGTRVLVIEHLPPRTVVVTPL